MAQHASTPTLATTSELFSAAAQAFAGALPATLPVAPQLHLAASTDAAQLMASGSTVTATFVGETSVDVAVSILPDLLGESEHLDPEVVSLDDILRPALESCTSVFGSGVLSSSGALNAHTVVEDQESSVFLLFCGEQRMGWFAVRLKNPVTAHSPVTPPVSARHGGTRVADEVSRLGRLRNVQMGLTVEIGRARVSVRDVLNLEPGAVIELDRNAGSPADVRLNGRLIAQGEVVVMDQEYGVRITSILDNPEGMQ